MDDTTVPSAPSPSPDLISQVESLQQRIKELETKHHETSANTPPEPPKPDESVTQMWGDSRFNPMFLKVAEYFGIDEKEYPRAVSKINTILDWAVNETKSKDMGDILLKISQTSRGLQSPGYSEKRYAILYRYVVLAREQSSLQKQMKALGQ